MVTRILGWFSTWASTPGRRWQFLLGLVLWNSFLFTLASFKPIPGVFQARRDASGFSHDKAQHFHYFHFYTGRFPLITLRDSVEYSNEGADLEISEHGSDLAMEYEHWSRLGEHARIWAYMPHAWITGTAAEPSIRLFNLIWFLAGGIVLYLGFCRAGMQMSGTLFVGLVNLTPFFWYEVHSRENIFGLQASLFMLITGLLISGMEHKPVAWRWLLGIGIGAMAIALGAEVRNEVLSLMACLLFMIVLSRSNWMMKATATLIAIAVFHVGRSAIRTHFDLKWESAYALVVERGGHAYEGPRIPGHKFWHPIFCGLGDYGGEKGYAWNDRVAYQYATPILNQRYGMDLRYSGAYHADNYYDSDSLYYVKFDEIEEYEILVKEKVMEDISGDPWWYIGILFQRILRTLTVTLPFKYAGWLIFPALWLAWRGKAHVDLAIMLAALPLSATSVLVYSGDGATYVSLFAYPALVFLLLRGVEHLNRRIGYVSLA